MLPAQRVGEHIANLEIGVGIDLKNMDTSLELVIHFIPQSLTIPTDCVVIVLHFDRLGYIALFWRNLACARRVPLILRGAFRTLTLFLLFLLGTNFVIVVLSGGMLLGPKTHHAKTIVPTEESANRVGKFQRRNVASKFFYRTVFSCNTQRLVLTPKHRVLGVLVLEVVFFQSVSLFQQFSGFDLFFLCPN